MQQAIDKGDQVRTQVLLTRFAQEHAAVALALKRYIVQRDASKATTQHSRARQRPRDIGR